EFVDLFGAEHGGRLDRRNVDRIERTTTADDGDGIEFGGGEAHRATRADLDLDVLGDARGGDLVATRSELREREVTVGAGGDFARRAGIQVLDLHGRATGGVAEDGTDGALRL